MLRTSISPQTIYRADINKSYNTVLFNANICVKVVAISSKLIFKDSILYTAIIPCQKNILNCLFYHMPFSNILA